ncbi:hypothetical protein DV20_12645 [Amycolatopsis rifamycinica]|uniref:CATRA-Associated Small Protein domain-containing protein n=1 Tax=Amycolatopsis rifamycinica TaxID=287986 RepID=A0A066UC29_9PSEU|nr:hypothetical protein DV20_12645 [Amycolatopsis rifamycinica]
MFQDDADTRRIREAAGTVLADVLGWSTTPQHWNRIADLVTAIERAADRADTGAFDAAVADLELAVPVRSNRIERSARERGGIDDDLRERVNSLQHRIEGVADEENADDHSGESHR